MGLSQPLLKNLERLAEKARFSRNYEDAEEYITKGKVDIMYYIY